MVAVATVSVLLVLLATASASPEEQPCPTTSSFAALLAAANAGQTAALERVLGGGGGGGGPGNRSRGAGATPPAPAVGDKDDQTDPPRRLPARLRERGLSYVGAAPRLRRVVDRLSGGGGARVSVGLVGGSISWGHGVRRGQEDWFARFVSWMRAAFPGAEIAARNGAVPAAQSQFAAVCLSKFVDADADVVFVEFTTNDGWAGGGAHTAASPLEHNSRALAYERLLRKLLARPSAPAVVVVHFLPTDARARGLPFFATAEDHYTTVAQHYGAPALSLRDAVWRPMRRNASGFAVDDIFLPGDERHPSALGHGYMADLARALVERVAWEGALLPGLVQAGRRPASGSYGGGGGGADGASAAAAAVAGPLGAALSLLGGPSSGGGSPLADVLIDPKLRAYYQRGPDHRAEGGLAAAADGGGGGAAGGATGGAASRRGAAAPLLPPPMFLRNREAEAEAGSSCASGVDLYALPSRRDDWYFVNEGSAVKPKWGWVAHVPGALLELPLDLRAAGGGGGGGGGGGTDSAPIRPLPTVSSAQRLALERRAALTGVPRGAQQQRSGRGRPSGGGGGGGGGQRNEGNSSGSSSAAGAQEEEEEEDDPEAAGGAEPVAGWRVASADAERAAAAAASGEALLRGDGAWSLGGGGEVRGAASGGGAGRLPPGMRAAPAALTAGADGVVEVGRRRRSRRKGRALRSAEDWLPGAIGRWFGGARRRRRGGADARRGEPEAALAAAAAADPSSSAFAPSAPAAPAPATVYVGYLQSYRSMGRARLSCASGCACAPLVVDAHAPGGGGGLGSGGGGLGGGGAGGGRTSQTVLARLRGVVPAPVAEGYGPEGRWRAAAAAPGASAAAPGGGLVGWRGGGGGGSKGGGGGPSGGQAATMCVVRVEALGRGNGGGGAGAGGSKFKVTAVMVSREVQYGAYGDFGDRTIPLALESQDEAAAAG